MPSKCHHAGSLKICHKKKLGKNSSEKNLVSFNVLSLVIIRI